MILALIAAALGALAGLGLLALLRIGAPSSVAQRAVSRRVQLPRLGRSSAVGLAVGIAAAAGTRWPVLGVATGFFAAQVVLGAEEAIAERRELDGRKALAEVATRLRALFAAGQSLPRAIASLAATGPPILRAKLVRLDAETRTAGVERALEAFGEASGDRHFAFFAATVAEAYRLGSADVGRQLEKLATNTAREVATLQELKAHQGVHRVAASVVAGASVAVLLFLRAQSPGYVRAYDDLVGQGVMAGGFGLIAVGYLALVRTARRHRRLGWLRSTDRPSRARTATWT